MGIEIERKFLVCSDSWRLLVQRSTPFEQGYLQTHPCTVRVRTEGDRGILTIKGKSSGLSRSEYEYEIPVNEAREMLHTLAQGMIIRKTRHLVPFGGKVWEIDEFFDENAGLIVAEVELEREDEYPELPDWVGQDVSLDSRYKNARLTQMPYTEWPVSVAG